MTNDEQVFVSILALPCGEREGLALKARQGANEGEIKKPLEMRGLTPVVAREPYRSLSGLALAPWRLSPGCRAVAGPEPSRSLDICTSSTGCGVCGQAELCGSPGTRETSVPSVSLNWCRRVARTRSTPTLAPVAWRTDQSRTRGTSILLWRGLPSPSITQARCG